MLKVEKLQAWYGRSHILQGIDLEVRRGELVCLIGRNGAGKTTTLRAIMGLTGRAEGRVIFDGQDVLKLPTHKRNGLGLGYVPEERRIVPGMSVRDNLRLGLLAAHHAASEAHVIAEIAETCWSSKMSNWHWALPIVPTSWTRARSCMSTPRVLFWPMKRSRNATARCDTVREISPHPLRLTPRCAIDAAPTSDW